MQLALCLFLCFTPVLAQRDDLAAKSRRGRELMTAGKFEEAIPFYRDLVRALPNNPGPIMNLGLALHMVGREREAVSEFQAVLKLEPNHLPARLFLGAAYLRLKEPARALEPLKTFVRAQPNDKEARLLLGEALSSLDRFEEAAKQFEKLTELDPANPKSWNGLGLSYESLASRNFEELEKIALGSPYWLVLVAEARAKADQYTRAFVFYRQALAKVPTMRGIHAAVADIYRKTGHPEWAAVEQDKELQMPLVNCSGGSPPVATLGASPNARGARRNQTPATDRQHSSDALECDFWAGRYSEIVASAKGFKTEEAYFWRTRACDRLALKAFSRLAELPPSAEVHELLAKIQFNRKNYPAALKEWRQALEFSPANPYYRQQLAISLSAGGEYESARQPLQDLLKQSPDSVELNYWFGVTLLGLAKAAEAIPFLEKAVESDPTELLMQRDLGRAYLQAGQAEKAVHHLKAALSIDEDGSLYFQLARAYRSTGQQELAKEMLRKFQEIQNSAPVEKKTREQETEITPP